MSAEDSQAIGVAGPAALDRLYGLAASPDYARDGVCFAARQSGLYKSDDGGRQWTRVVTSPDPTEDQGQPITATAISPDFAVDRAVFAGGLGGILRSVDGGRQWTAVAFRAPPPLVTTLAASPDFACDGVLLAGTLEDGVFRSADRGRTWAPWNFGLLDLHVLSLALTASFADDETVFAGTEIGLFRSTNGGRAWREVAFPANAAPVLSLAVSPQYSADGVLFAGTEANGLYHSEDRGQTWDNRGEALKDQAVNAVILSPHFPTRPHVLAAVENRLLISRDGGGAWSARAPESILGEGIAAVAAPQGLGKNAPVLVGLADGSIVSV
jgi:photosystem II stability/assembly factor-like uncharacterized protein